MSEDQITIRELGCFRWSLEFSYNEEFIDWLKRRIPAADRSYDPETHIWRVSGDSDVRLNAIESIAVQKFRFAVRWYKNAEGKLTMRNLKTGAETVQEELFS